MLSSLSIKNYALIDSLDVQFSDGLIIITGETGAGKSILLGGLALVLGKRADLSSLKNQDRKCIIEASFLIEGYQLREFFKENDLDYEVETIIRREILPSGKSRAFVNDSPVNLNVLSGLGSYLIDVHSQHQTMQLTENAFQFKVIDALAATNDDLEAYQEQYKVYKTAQRTLNELLAFEQNASKEQDYNEFLLNELVEANLIAGELESLESTYETLNNVEEIKLHLATANKVLNDEQIGILSNATQLRNSLEQASQLSSEYKLLQERIHSILIELDDVSTAIEDANDNLEADPQKLNQVNDKLQAIYDLQKKHAVLGIDELIKIQEDLEQKVSTVHNIETEIEAKQLAVTKAESALNKIAETIHEKRQKAIPTLTNQLTSILADLGMVNARFDIQTTLADTFFSNGKETLQFHFAANKGTSFGELKKVASGGELSRIMLSIKAILSKYMRLPTIMFDEIDTGVSGEVSNKIGAIMQQMSKTMQVFTITHLPQIAAKGNSHYKVYKEDINEITTTSLKRLNEDDRIIEIAQMLGGKEISSSAMAHAKQLLN
ncbi:DNA repair protein RecN [Spongiivirga citrea]|uniref:DNA repair protein RecN n=1 Tax=Spongiivirga citrea TaxID=1481457 RepID=A0A6M0CI86_9FLAO|nr:DNA repair protein RecN [Spongiivirga citrea]NER17605.1 DNA repair protein RecN [Spongiivirga citrea]